MWIGYHNYLVVVLDVREPIANSVHVDHIAHAANRSAQPVFFQFAFKKALRVEDVKPGRIVLEHCLPLMPALHSQICYGVRMSPAIVD